MKPRGGNPRKAGPQRSGSDWNAPLPPQLPMAWMDPMSWRLPSGQALAEFALQSGFLAPLILGSPSIRRRKPAASANGVAKPTVIDKRLEEGPDASGTFRGHR
jgi:hypothetical protein